MLRTLRARRRPCWCGAYVCVAVSAFLLLLSVSILHSRLESDQWSRRSPFQILSTENEIFDTNDDPDLGQNLDLDELNLIKSENDGERDENGMDETDNSVQRDKRKGYNEHEDIRASGYVWDHLIRVKRRAFGKGSDEFESDIDGDSLPSLDSEDRVRMSFGSDDQPIDENVRRKLDQITGIEDVLLLKSNKDSSLKEGWANWFEKKGDFLRKDRMFRSSLDLFNPLSHPLLQDPDGPGKTGLTRGDKLMQKTIWKEIEKVPFMSQKTSSIKENFHENENMRMKQVKDKKSRNLTENVTNANDVDKLKEPNRGETMMKRSDRRVLDEAIANNAGSSTQNSGNGEQLPIHLFKKQKIPPERSSLKELRIRKDAQYTNYVALDENLSTLAQPREDGQLSTTIENKFKVKEPIYADGRRWGYYPGLDPYLPFSNFMKKFFALGHCSMRVFMVWNTPPWTYGVRHHRGLESLLYHHPDACVVLFSETIDLDFFDNYVKERYKVTVVMPDLDELLKGTPVSAFASVWHKWRRIPFYFMHYSELIRLVALYRYGGIYLDSDVIVLKPLNSLKNSFGVEDQISDAPILNGAVMSFQRQSSFVLECLKEFYSTYDNTRLRWNGADLLVRVVNRMVNRWNGSHSQMEFKLEPPFTFFPINSLSILRYFSVPSSGGERFQQDLLYKQILNESLTFHFWNGITSSLVPEPGSIVEKLLNLHCLHCTDTM